MKSVMIVSTASAIGGMERIVCGLARGLTEQGLIVRTFFPGSADAPVLLAWCRDQGVDAEIHPAVLGADEPHSMSAARAFGELITTVDPDVVNLHYGDNFLSLWDVVGARRARDRQRALVASIHHPTEWSGENRRKRAMTAIASRLCHRVTTFSQATQDVVRRAGVPSEQMTLIPCGVARPHDPPSRADARRILGIADDTFVVSSLARLVEYKGIGRLIEAVDIPELAGTTLLVGGDGPDREALERRAAETEAVDVRILGRIRDVDVLFAAADVFALPSRLEGFGLVYVEAAMFGVPSVASDVGGVPDAVIDGKTGILVDPESTAAIRAAIVRLHRSPVDRRRLGDAARQRALLDLNETTMAERFSAEFRRTLGRNWERSDRLQPPRPPRQG